MARRQPYSDEAEATFSLPVVLEVAAQACVEEAQFMGGMLGGMLGPVGDVVDDEGEDWGTLSGEIRWRGSRLRLHARLEPTQEGTSIRLVAAGQDADLREVLETLQAHIESELMLARHDSWTRRIEPLPGRSRQEPHLAALAPPALKLFISYRRSDSDDFVGHINDRLSAYFGQDAVYRDVDSIPSGHDFRTHITDAVERCDVLLAIIGRSWLTTPSEHGRGRRLAQRNDFVRIEIESALRLGRTVVPVLIHGAVIPTAAELPPSLRPLANRQAAEVRPDPDFHTDIDRLILRLRKDLLAEQTSP